MVGRILWQVEVQARVRHRGEKQPRDVCFTFDNPLVRVFSAPSGYVIVVDDDYYNDHSVYWGDTLEDALRAYYGDEEGVEVLEAKVTRVEDWEEEEEEEEWWEEELEELDD